MPYSEAQHRASMKYERANYERISILLRKGDRDRIRAVAEKAGKSITGWAKDLIYEALTAAEAEDQEKN